MKTKKIPEPNDSTAAIVNMMRAAASIGADFDELNGVVITHKTSPHRRYRDELLTYRMWTAIHNLRDALGELMADEIAAERIAIEEKATAK